MAPTAQEAIALKQNETVDFMIPILQTVYTVHLYLTKLQIRPTAQGLPRCRGIGLLEANTVTFDQNRLDALLLDFYHHPSSKPIDHQFQTLTHCRSTSREA